MSMEPSGELSVPLFHMNPDDSHLQEMIDFLFKSDNTENISTLCNGPCPHHMIVSSFPYDSIPYDDIFPSSAVDTERDHGSSPSTVSPVPTYSYHTILPSTSEDAFEALSALEEAKSAIENNSGNRGGDCINVINPGNCALPAALSKPGCSRTCTGCHDAPGLPAFEAKIRRVEFFKGVTKKNNSDKWTCEIRISKNFLRDSTQKPKGKQWLGTFDTRCQAARALHVGRFLLSDKKKNSITDANFEQNPDTIRALSEFKDSMRRKPLDAKLLLAVKTLAADYGNNGSLTGSLSCMFL